MNFFKLILGFCTIGMIATIIACSNDGNASDELQKANQSGLDLSGLDLDFSHFVNNEDYFEGSREKINSDFFNYFENVIFNEEWLANFANVDEEDANTYVKWEVTLLSENKMHIKQSVFQSVPLTTNNEDNSRCPNGVSEYAACSGLSPKKVQDCVTEKMGKLTDSMNIGETISITRTGLTTVVVCASKSLVDRLLSPK